MKGLFILACVLACSWAAPQHWSTRRQLLTHRNNPPARTNYKYLPTLEDDEQVPVGRQETVVQTTEAAIVPAPVVVEPVKDKVQTQGPSPGSVPVGRPVGPPGAAGKPVERPPFRPPPAKPQKEEEEEEDEEDDQSEEGADDGDDEEDDDDDDDEQEDEDEEEEERKRQEKVPEKNEAVNRETAPSSVQVKTQSQRVVSGESVEDVQSIPSVDSNEVVSPGGALGNLDDGMEALVPGYITDQGEVLVPVDTVSGDQHISIVPDPYTRLRRGQHSHHSFRNHPIYYEEEGHEGYFDY